jgi:O-antigen/teichoic acid export membrane protein
VYRLWTGRHLTLDPILFDVFLVQAVCMVFWSSSALVLLACNRQRAYASWMFANALVTIVLAIVFVRYWGAVGVAVASLIGDLACCAWVLPRLASRVLGDTDWSFWRVALVPGLAIGLVVGAATEWIRQAAHPTGAASVLWALSVAATYLAAVYWLWMDLDERQRFRHLRQHVLGLVSL